MSHCSKKRNASLFVSAICYAPPRNSRIYLALQMMCCCKLRSNMAMYLISFSDVSRIVKAHRKHVNRLRYHPPTVYYYRYCERHTGVLHVIYTRDFLSLSLSLSLFLSPLSVLYIDSVRLISLSENSSKNTRMGPQTVIPNVHTLNHPMNNVVFFSVFFFFFFY